MIEPQTIPPKSNAQPVLVIVEGQFDIEFLRRVSHTLHLKEPGLPCLAADEASGKAILVPFGGGGHAEWAERFQSLCLPEFHLFDRETPPETECRIATAETINRREHCRAVVMQRRSLENYLHPDAIAEALGVSIEFGPQCSVVERVATELYETGSFAVPWQELSRKGRHRLFNRLKRRLNTTAADRMSVSRLDQADPACEIRVWLRLIADLASGRI